MRTRFNPETIHRRAEGGPSIGRFIALEGGEGAGKTGQIPMLAQYMREQFQLDVVETREPGGAPHAERIRKLLLADGNQASPDPVTDLLLIMAARREHMEKRVWPALREKKWVLCDRFLFSTYCYQCHGYGLESAWIDRLHMLVAEGLKPDFTLILDIDPEMGLARKRTSHDAGAEAHIGGEDADFHRRVRKGFHALAEQKQHRCAIIDASVPEAEVAASCRRSLDTYINGLHQK